MTVNVGGKAQRREDKVSEEKEKVESIQRVEEGAKRILGEEEENAARKEKEAAAPGMRDQDEDKKKEDKAPMKEAVNKKIQMELKLRRLVREALTKADTLNRK